MISFKETRIDGLFYRELKPFYDFRGQFIELWNEQINIKFIEDDISISHKDVLRGFHIDCIATKLITPIIGDIFLAFIDKDFNGQSFYCTNGQRYQFLIKPNVGICHLVLSEIGVLHYKQDRAYNISNQTTVKWDDYRVDIHFPIGSPILSERDC